MKEFAIVGRPNSGKTLFALNFALYLGCKELDITFRGYDGSLTCKPLLISDAKKELCGSQVHKTRYVQSMVLSVPVGKAGVQFKLNDTCGITENIHPDEAIRRGMAQTLSLVRSCDFIFHVIDLAVFNTDNFFSDNNIDCEVYHYGLARNRYVLLANKIDLPVAQMKLAKLPGIFNPARILPVSALHNMGFQAVKSFVAGNV